MTFLLLLIASGIQLFELASYNYYQSSSVRIAVAAGSSTPPTLSK